MKILKQNEIQQVSGAMSSAEAASFVITTAAIGALIGLSKAYDMSPDLGMFSYAGFVANHMALGAFGGTFVASFIGMSAESSDAYYEATRDTNIKHIHLV